LGRKRAAPTLRPALEAPRPRPIEQARVVNPAPAAVVTPPPAPAPAPAAPVEQREPRRGNGWMSELLARASRDEQEAAPEPVQAAPAGTSSLDTLNSDIGRMIEHDAASDVWDRYRRGERGVFTRRLYTLQGQQAYEEIRRRYRRDADFRETVDRYVDQFEGLIAEVDRSDRTGAMAKTYLTADTGKVYTILAHAAGRLG